MTMIRVSSSQLKAKLGKYMQAIREGKQVVVTDRQEPIARLVPYRKQRQQALRVSAPRDPAAPPLGAVKVRSIRRRDIDTTALLRQDRDRR